MTKAVKLLERLNSLVPESFAADNPGTAAAILGGAAALGVAGHYAHRSLERDNLKKAGFVQHPTSKSHMIHPGTGQVKRLPRWFDSR